jgi:purine-nucleoside phosphorylase
MSSSQASLGLDETVFPLRERLRLAGVPDPAVLFLMGTGVGFLPEKLRAYATHDLGEWCASLGPWQEQVLHTGRLAELPVWLLDDVSGDPSEDEPESPWVRALPVWLAAASGAQVLVHTSAGSALSRAQPTPALALVSDHLNCSGTTPLLGLGESKLGPLFPDLSGLYHAGLRAAARERAQALGVPTFEAVVACTLGPALETPAERRMLARLGADVSVQNLATPLLAAAHAGLTALALVAVGDADAGPADVRRVLSAAETLQPAIEDLLVALAPALSETSFARAAEVDA